jgi:hypothetical protein
MWCAGSRSASSRQVMRTYYYYHYCAHLIPLCAPLSACEREWLILAVHSSLASPPSLPSNTAVWLPADTLTCLISSSKWCFRLAHSWSGANPGALEAVLVGNSLNTTSRWPSAYAVRAPTFEIVVADKRPVHPNWTYWSNSHHEINPDRWQQTLKGTSIKSTPICICQQQALQ